MVFLTRAVLLLLRYARWVHHEASRGMLGPEDLARHSTHQPASAKIVAPRHCQVACPGRRQIPHAHELQDRTTSADYSAVTEAMNI